MARGGAVRGFANVLVLAVCATACGGSAAGDVPPTVHETGLPNSAGVNVAPVAEHEAVEQAVPSASVAVDSAPAESAASAAETESPESEPTVNDSTVETTVETSDTEAQTVATGQANLECPEGGCDEMTCDTGFVAFPDLEAGQCLEICDTTDLLPLDTQEKVSRLAAQNCAVIEGGLTVSGPLVSDLNGLESIRRVGGDLVIQDTALGTLAGLSRLSQVSGTFVLSGNSELVELGFSMFRDMGDGGLVVLSNPKLSTLAGLEGARFPAISVTIVGNAALLELEGLQNLSNALSFVIAQNAALADVSALNGLGAVETLTVTENASLSAFELSTLSTVGNLTIASNSTLQSVLLRCVGPSGVVAVENNPELTRLLIPSLVATSLSVSQNPKLPLCSIQGIVEAAGGCVNCEGNDTTTTCE